MPPSVAQMTAALAEQYEARFDELRRRARVLPGVEAVLSLLDQKPEVTQTVLTGNPRAVALIKLRTTGLVDQMRWDCGAFGDDHRDRAELVRIARQRCGSNGTDVGKVIVVGDTPADITAARAAGARAVGVATGRFTTAELDTAGADATLTDLADLDAVQEALDLRRH